jgi:hypothetical protein
MTESSARGTGSEFPMMTVDLDGVVCGPLLGQNLGIHQTLLDPEASPPTGRAWPRWMGTPLDHLRFDLRRPLHGAQEALERLSQRRRLVLLTGRRSDPSYWLRWYGLERFYSQVVINEGALKSPHHKLEQVARLGAVEHVDDDGRTAQLLAQRSGAQVYLCDWPRNRWIDLDGSVRRVANLEALADLIEVGDADGALDRVQHGR